MKLTLLGTSGAYPDVGDACSGYLIQSKSNAILIDCGSGVFSNLQKFIDFQSVDAIFISHMHADHFIDLIAMRYSIRYGSIRDEIPVYLPLGGVAQLNSIARNLSSTESFFRNSLRLNQYKEYEKYQFGDIIVTPFEVEHSVLSHGMLVADGEKKIVYSSDTVFCDSIKNMAKEADVLLSENALGGGAPINEPINHLSSKEAGMLAKIGRVDKLILTHFWPTSNRELCKEEASTAFDGEIIIGSSGMTVSI